MTISPPPDDGGGAPPPPLPIPPCPVPLPRDAPRSLSAPVIPPTPELPPEQPLPKEDRGPDGRFIPGNSGRPKGARHKVTMAVEALMEGQWEVLSKTAVALALRGDTTALRLCFERIAPPRRGRVTPIADFPVPKTAADIPAALSHLTSAVANGEVTAGEADEMAKLIDRFVAAFDAATFAERLADLEKRVEEAQRHGSR